MVRKTLPEDVSLYLSRTALLIRDGQVDVEGAESFVLDNVFRETDGLEVDMLRDKKASKCLETVVGVASPLQLRALLHRLVLSLGTQGDLIPFLLACSPDCSSSLCVIGLCLVCFTRFTLSFLSCSCSC